MKRSCFKGVFCSKVGVNQTVILNLFQDLYLRRAFTLIELLVVVVIIAILAAVAVPQYQRALEKSKATQAFALIKSIYHAQTTFYLSHGKYATSFNELDVEIPFTGSVPYYTNSVAKDTRSNDDWSAQIYGSDASFGIVMGRLQGKYAGAGFGMFLESTRFPTGIPLCLEYMKEAGITFGQEEGAYCKKLFNGTLAFAGDTYFYKF